MIEPKEELMRMAIDEALKSQLAGDYAIGAVIARNDEPVFRAGNEVKQYNDPTAHAEIVAISGVARMLGTRHLTGCVLYTTHEPCPMCSSAAVWARMLGIVYGTRIEDMEYYREQKGNNDWSWRTINVSALEVIAKGEPKLHVVKEFMREECLKLFHS